MRPTQQGDDFAVDTRAARPGQLSRAASRCRWRRLGRPREHPAWRRPVRAAAAADAALSMASHSAAARAAEAARGRAARLCSTWRPSSARKTPARVQRAASDGRGRALRRLRAQDRARARARGLALDGARQPDHPAPDAALARRPEPRPTVWRRSWRASAIGVVPFDPERAAVAGRPDRARAAARLAVAGFAAGNVMLLSVSVWAGDVYGMGAGDARPYCTGSRR